MTTITETHVKEHEADLTVVARGIVADGVAAIELAAPDGSPLPSWTPGAHIDLVLTDQLTRQYSLCGSPSEAGRWRIAVLRTPDSQGGSIRVHETLVEGATVRVRGPRNHFALVASPRYIFIAGGIGITPLLPMLAGASAAGAGWRLYYGGRSAGSMAFRDELAEHGDRVSLVPQDEQGLLDLDGVLGDPAPGHPGLLLRPGTTAERRGGQVRLLAARRPASRALHRQAGRTARRGRHRLRGGSATLGDHSPRPGGYLDLRRRTCSRGECARFVPEGDLRHLRDRSTARPGRPPRLRAQRGGAGQRRVHDDLRVPMPR